MRKRLRVKGKYSLCVTNGGHGGKAQERDGREEEPGAFRFRAKWASIYQQRGAAPVTRKMRVGIFGVVLRRQCLPLALTLRRLPWIDVGRNQSLSPYRVALVETLGGRPIVSTGGSEARLSREGEAGEVVEGGQRRR